MQRQLFPDLNEESQKQSDKKRLNQERIDLANLNQIVERFKEEFCAEDVIKKVDKEIEEFESLFKVLN